NVLSVSNALGTTTFTYDEDGNLTSESRPDGRSISYRYDGDRLVEETWRNADGSVADVLSYAYDEEGNLLAASNSAGTYSMTFDGGRLRTWTDPSGLTLTYGYDEEGNVTSIADSQGGL